MQPPAGGLETGLSRYFEIEKNARTGADRLSGNGLTFGTLRPGANILATLGKQGDHSSEPVPAIVSMQLGSGNVLVFGLADSWRLKIGEAASDEQHPGLFETLWQGILLDSVSGIVEQTALESESVSIAEGEDARFSLTARDTRFLPLRIQTVSAQILRIDDDKAQPDATYVAFSPDFGGETTWNATVQHIKSGRYVLNVDYRADGRPGTIQRRFAVSNRRGLATGAANDQLEVSAREIGGKIFRASAVDTMVSETVSRPSATRNEPSRWRLIDFWPLALMIPLLLSAEWLLQRFAESSLTSSTESAPATIN